MSYTIHINHKKENGGSKDHIIYTRKEAEEANIEFFDWKVAKEGQYAVTDDNYVAEVLKVKYYSTGKGESKYMRMPFGYVLYNPKYKQKFKAMGRRSPHTFTGKDVMDVKCASDDKMKRLAMAFAMTNDKDLSLDMALGDHTNSKHDTYKRRMKTEVFSKMVREELEKLLKEHGLTESFTLSLLADTIDLAKNKQDVTNLLKAVTNLQDMHGMKEKKQVRTTQQLEASTTQRLLDRIDEDKLIATQTTYEDVDE